MTPQERLDAAIGDATNVYMSTKSEIVDYFRTEHPKNWREEFTNAMQAITGQSRNTVSRQVQGNRADKAPKQKAVIENYKKLGSELPPKGRKLPPGGITVKVKGKFNPSPKRKAKGGQEREREIDVTFTGSAGEMFINDPSLEAFFEEYGVDGPQFVDMMDDSASISVA